MRRVHQSLIALAVLSLAVLGLNVAVAETPPEQKGGLSWREIPPRPKLDYVLPRPGRMDVRLDILVDGRPMRVIHHRGRDYLPVPSFDLPYEIRVRNSGSRRVTAIVSVDGLSVITRKSASMHDPGYLIDRGGDIVIKGFRRDRDIVSEFRFVSRDQSYASKIGQEENVGVIGLIAIEEWTRPELLREERLDRGRYGSAKAEVGGTGTEAGRDVHSPSYLVPFVRGKNQMRITLYYDTVAALKKAGVPVEPRDPVPFPQDR